MHRCLCKSITLNRKTISCRVNAQWKGHRYRLFWVPTCFILTKRNDIRVVIVNEAWKSTGLAQTHADLTVVPTARVTVLLQTHQASAGNAHRSDFAHENTLSLLKFQGILQVNCRTCMQVDVLSNICWLHARLQNVFSISNISD